MALFRNRPIRQKLMTLILAISGVVLLLTCAAFISYEIITYRRDALQQIATLSEIIAAESTGAVAFDNQRDAAEILSALKAERHIEAACLYDREGRVFARYLANLSDKRMPLVPQEDGYRFSHGHLVGFTPVVQTKGSQRFGTLYISYDMEAMYERLRLYGTIAFSVIVTALLVAYTLSRTLQKQISHPILALAETAKAISDQRDYSVRATKVSDDELGLLTDAFNHMLAQIQEQNAMLEKRVRERTAELESANDELEAFCSSAAHDLRTPLRAITGFADILLDPRTNVSTSDAKRYIQMVRDGSGQMTQLINDLLAFSRTGRQELTREVVDMEKLCREVFRELENEWSHRQIEIRVLPMPPALGDRALLKVVFVNLLSNALKYTRPRAATVVTIGVDEKTKDENVPVYFVQDNGVGFDMKDADKLFGVFQRLHHATEFEGTGVGLATARRIIERHGGRIWAASETNAGAKFYFTLSCL